MDSLLLKVGQLLSEVKGRTEDYLQIRRGQTAGSRVRTTQRISVAISVRERDRRSVRNEVSTMCFSPDEPIY